MQYLQKCIFFLRLILFFYLCSVQGSYGYIEFFLHISFTGQQLIQWITLSTFEQLGLVGKTYGPTFGPIKLLKSHTPGNRTNL